MKGRKFAFKIQREGMVSPARGTYRCHSERSEESRSALAACGRKNQGKIPRSAVESHVIPAKAGIQIAQVDPRLRGGDEGPTFISMGGLQAHGHSEWRGQVKFLESKNGW
jgi:hypothetical protein